MKNLLRPLHIKLILLAILAFSSSCSSTKGWVYRSNSYDKTDVSNIFSNSSVAIMPFYDKRSNINKNNYLLYMIPLMPFGYQDLSSPETVQVHMNSGMWMNFNPKEDFAKAMAEEISVAGIFKEAFFSHSSRESDYYISGELVSTDYNGKIITYGLSIYGSFLWYVGFPATHIKNSLELKLSLIDNKSKKIVFTKIYQAQPYAKTGWIYKLPEDFNYSAMLASIYKNFVEDLSNLKI